MSRVFLTKWFARYARKERFDEASLLNAIDQADLGIVAANLGGCLVKLRVARTGAGKSGGYRTIVAYRRGDRAFFLFAFAKNELENISRQEQTELEKIGAILLDYDDAELARALGRGEITEINRQ